MTDEVPEHKLLMQRGLPPTPQNAGSISKDIFKIKLAHDMKAEDSQVAFEHSTMWTSCCFRLDKRAISYFGQMLVGIGLCVFCVCMLVVNQDCATFSRYSPLLSFIVGVLLPQPQLNRRED